MTVDDSKYKYQPLGVREIRLLEFCSSSSDELTFNIIHKQLDSRTTSYAALSHTWTGHGDLKDVDFPCRITIGDSHLAITENLRDALVHIKLRFAKSGSLRPTLLWVDAICINQSDKDEKGRQVSLMSHLYDQASHVYVWLGNPGNDHNTRLAVEMHDYLKSLWYKATAPTSPWWWPQRACNTNQDVYLAYSSMLSKNIKNIMDVEGTEPHNAWLGIAEMCRHPWWTRTWILQESTIKEPYESFAIYGVVVKKPAHKVDFFIGQHTTHWEGFVCSYMAANILLKMPLLNKSTKMLRGLFANVAKVESIRANRLLGLQPELLEQLQLARYAASWNPRDKIYSSLGMLADTVAPLIVPDYEKSPLDLYLDIARISLNQSPSTLDFLGHAMKLDEPRRPLSEEINHQSWPSWIPNWDDPLNVVPFPKKVYTNTLKQGHSMFNFRIHMERQFYQVTGKAYNASRNECMDASVLGYTLRIKGAIIDTIVDRHSFQTAYGERVDIINRWYNNADKKYPTGEDFNVGLLTAQVADMKSDLSGYPMGRGNELNRELLYKPLSDLTTEEQEEQVKMRRAMDNATIYRGLCLTNLGYVGLVPWSARSGDHICLLFGGQVLYVLRPTEEPTNFEYIGEAYVYGLMDGEAMDWVQQGKSSVTHFTLI